MRGMRGAAHQTRGFDVTLLEVLLQSAEQSRLFAHDHLELLIIRIHVVEHERDLPDPRTRSGLAHADT